MSEDGADEELASILSLLEDRYTRTILVETSVESMSAQELADRCDVADSTIYRRIERLQEHDLVAESQVLDSDGHHYKKYRARLDRVTIDLEPGEFSVDVARVEEDPVDRFTRLYEELR